MVIKNLEKQNQTGGHHLYRFSRGMCHHQLVKHLTARTMVSDAQKKVYVLDGNVPIS